MKSINSAEDPTASSAQAPSRKPVVPGRQGVASALLATVLSLIGTSVLVQAQSSEETVLPETVNAEELAMNYRIVSEDRYQDLQFNVEGQGIRIREDLAALTGAQSDDLAIVYRFADQDGEWRIRARATAGATRRGQHGDGGPLREIKLLDRPRGGNWVTVRPRAGDEPRVAGMIARGAMVLDLDVLRALLTKSALATQIPSDGLHQKTPGASGGKGAPTPGGPGACPMMQVAPGIELRIEFGTISAPLTLSKWSACLSVERQRAIESMTNQAPKAP